MKKTYLLLLLLFCVISARSQERYLNQKFAEVETSTVIYGQNYTILTLSTAGQTTKIPLPADVYKPKGDTETKRPLVIYLHTGNFLPFPQNGGTGGTRSDSTAVEICTRLAKMGYVVASADYRLGWDPLNATPDVRKGTLIRAAWAGVQDIRSCIRYFKANATTLGIDTSKIVVWGQGTGGYLSLALATLDSYNEILTTTNGPNKFRLGNVATGNPMVIEAYDGTVEGLGAETKSPTLPSGTYWGIPAGNVIQSPSSATSTISSQFQLCVNMGGALGDISWLDSKSTPIVSFHTPYDPYAPYKDDLLIVPTTGETVVQVQGSYEVLKKVNTLGLNDKFKKIKATADPYKAIANARNDGYEGLLPLLGDFKFDSSPWDFWASTNTNNANGLLTNPNMSATKARKYIDTIVGYYAPRACVALNLPCASLVSSNEELLNSSNTKLLATPNPAQKIVAFESDVYNPIQTIELFDMSGRSVIQARNINTHYYQLDRGTLPNGMYIAKVKFEGGILTKKIVFEQQ